MVLAKSKVCLCVFVYPSVRILVYKNTSPSRSALPNASKIKLYHQNINQISLQLQSTIKIIKSLQTSQTPPSPHQTTRTIPTLKMGCCMSSEKDYDTPNVRVRRGPSPYPQTVQGARGGSRHQDPYIQSKNRRAISGSEYDRRADRIYGDLWYVLGMRDI